jgi:hypothetical protein
VPVEVGPRHSVRAAAWAASFTVLRNSWRQCGANTSRTHLRLQPVSGQLASGRRSVRNRPKWYELAKHARCHFDGLPAPNQLTATVTPGEIHFGQGYLREKPGRSSLSAFLELASAEGLMMGILSAGLSQSAACSSTDLGLQNHDFTTRFPERYFACDACGR